MTNESYNRKRGGEALYAQMRMEWRNEDSRRESEKRSVSSFNRARPTPCVMNGRGILKKKK